jgi:hypothetical protein
MDTCQGVCTTSDVITSTSNTTIRTQLTNVGAILQSFFSVKNANVGWEGVSNSTQRCQFLHNYGVKIPSVYYTPDPSANYDTVVFVTMRPQEAIINFQGMYCATSSVTGRPIMGLLNISPAKLSFLSDVQGYLLHGMIVLILHYSLLY